MKLREILTPERCHCRLDGVSKKRLLVAASRLIEAAAPTIAAGEVFEAIMARERLGSTGVGHGVALPHCKLPSCDRILGALITLREPIDFDAIDGMPVDLLFLLVVPNAQADEHVRTLSRIAAAFSDAKLRLSLRQSGMPRDLFELATAMDATLDD